MEMHVSPQVSDAQSCEICHEAFRSKNVRVLKCGHKFHKGVRILCHLHVRHFDCREFGQ